jgi:hypothetical protein
MIGGEFGTVQGKEYSDQKRGTYEPEWVDIDSHFILHVRPKQVSLKIKRLFV